jgi:hypothetical protein
MKHRLLLLLMLLAYSIVSGQKTIVQGTVKDKETGEPLPFVNLKFIDTKFGGTTNLEGKYVIESYYATDSLEVTFVGYLTKRVKVKVGVTQTIDVELEPNSGMLQDVVVTPPDELPSARLMRLVVKNKPINNREKLIAYEYETYNKVQIDLNNIGDGFEEMGLVNKLGEVLNYLDSNQQGKFLPMMLSESVSRYYFRTNPQKKREVMEATYLTGVDNLEVTQFMGDMYQDINIYDNNIFLFGKQFVSPISNAYKQFYKYYLADSAFIGNQWCYKLTFTPKRKGDLTFEGEMWIHDTTYAVKQIVGDISPTANMNYVQGLHFEQYFEQVEPEVWMLVKEKVIADFKLTRRSKIVGFYGRKTTMRKDFVINKPREPEFYNSPDRVEMKDDAKYKDDAYWQAHRHEPLSTSEQGVINMVDTLMYNPTFRFLQNAGYMVSTGHYRLNKIELGNIYNLISFNEVEGIRNEISLRTANKFSRRIEFSGRLAYGWSDQRVKYGVAVRYNVTPWKRGMLSAFYRSDIEQLGMSPSAKEVGATFGTLLRTGPLDKLTFVKKTGVNFEKDVGKDLILYSGFEWKSYVPLGIADYKRYDAEGIIRDVDEIRASEFTVKLRWGKNEEFVSGQFDRISIGSRFPILSLQAILGIRDLFGSDYNYQKIEFQLTHRARIGYMGELRYNLQAGYVFGRAAYPFLAVHPGNQSYWLQREAFNNMSFFEFVSDRYVSLMVDHLWGGLLDRIPGVRKLKWRTVLSFRGVVGEMTSRHLSEMILPDVTRSLDWNPYGEVGVGIANMFNYLRVEFTWRVMQRVQGINNFGIRLRMDFDF